MTGATKAHVSQHIASKRHKEQVKLKDQANLRQQKIYETGESSRSEYIKDLCKMALATNIPFTRLNHPVLEEFMRKYAQQRPVDRTTLTKNYLPLCYEEVI